MHCSGRAGKLKDEAFVPVLCAGLLLQQADELNTPPQGPPGEGREETGFCSVQDSSHQTTGRDRAARWVNRWPGKFIYLPLLPSSHLSIYPSPNYTHPSTYPLSHRSLFHLSSHPPIYTLICLFIYSSSIHSPLYPPPHPSIHLPPTHISVYLSTYTPIFLPSILPHISSTQLFVPGGTISSHCSGLRTPCKAGCSGFPGADYTAWSHVTVVSSTLS